jgi:hypothetical protein
MIRIGDIVQVRNFHLSNIVLEPCYLIPSCAGTARGVDAVSTGIVLASTTAVDGSSC